ncbi:MAG: four helix bundle protein [Chloroflexota bacterium]|nr:four helix bundle protein [Chloroflexota bacterium]
MPFRFESLDIWHMARTYATKVYALTARFPRRENYGLTSQLNRAANSIALNIAEGAGKSSDRAFDYHLDVAVGSIFEVVSGSFLALDRGYITEQEQRRLYDDGEQLGKSVNAFRKTLRP